MRPFSREAMQDVVSGLRTFAFWAVICVIAVQILSSVLGKVNDTGPTIAMTNLIDDLEGLPEFQIVKINNCGIDKNDFYYSCSYTGHGRTISIRQPKQDARVDSVVLWSECVVSSSDPPRGCRQLTISEMSSIVAALCPVIDKTSAMHAVARLESELSEAAWRRIDPHSPSEPVRYVKDETPSCAIMIHEQKDRHQLYVYRKNPTLEQHG